MLTKLNNNSLHAITDGSALKNATGTVLQTVNNTHTTQISTSAFTDVGVATSITPKSSSSKILVMVTLEMVLR